MKRYIVQNIKLSPDVEKDAVFALAKARLLTFFGKKDILRTEICKRSIDARRRNDIKFVWSVMADVTSDKTPDASRLAAEGIVAAKDSKLNISYGNEPMNGRPVIVGFGPCGMFCALILAQNGYRPIILERGKNIDERTLDVENFMRGGELCENSNIQFGAGGAGTFSDGKLLSRINDEKCAVVINEMHRHGAPDDILYNAKPHVGTDKLKVVVRSVADEIKKLGGDIFYKTALEGLISENGYVKAVKTNRGEIECGAVVLAIGHSARDTFSAIGRDGVKLLPKPFSVGVRAEHLQEDIDKMLYGDMAGSEFLPKGEYSLSHRCGGGHGVYTFCMCPGGEVVAAASEYGGIVTNGMSYHARNGKNANAAVCVSVFPEDYGNTVQGAIEFQKNIERSAYKAAGNSYFAPATTMGDFLGDTRGASFSRVMPTYMNGNVTPSNFQNIFPAFVVDAIKEGIADFDKKMHGYASRDAVLTAPETRTSSPIRIPRNDTFTATDFDNLYPCGEGAGYAGGITSAGVDGINCALRIMSRYKIKI